LTEKINVDTCSDGLAKFVAQIAEFFDNRDKLNSYFEPEQLIAAYDD